MSAGMPARQTWILLRRATADKGARATRVWGRLRVLGEDDSDPLFEVRQIMIEHVPDDIQVDAEVFMDQDVTKAGGQGPDLGGVLGSEVRGQCTTGFADDHQVMDDPGLDEFIGLKGAPASPSVFSRYARWHRGCRRAARDRPSQGDGLAKDSIADAVAEAAFGDDVNFSVEDCLQVEQQAAEVEETAAGIEVHEKIDIAPGVAVAPGDGAKDADVSGSAVGGDTKNFIALRCSEDLQGHSDFSLPRNRQRRVAWAGRQKTCRQECRPGRP